MKSFWKWLTLIGAISLGLIAFLFWNRGLSIFGSVKAELDVADQKAKMKKMLADKKAEKARLMIEIEHFDTIKEMDDEQRKHAEQLRADPVALSAYMVRVGARLRAKRNKT